jgi:hypothetical protein
MEIPYYTGMRRQRTFTVHDYIDFLRRAKWKLERKTGCDLKYCEREKKKEKKRKKEKSQMGSLEFFINIILPIAIWPWGRISL